MRELYSTIAAISTPPGKGGVAIIRISGENSLSVLRRVFRSAGSKKPPENPIPRKMIYGDIVSGDEVIDDGMCVYFPAPNSYTGEDMVEIFCHGGVLVTQNVLSLVLSAGCIMAEAGEFTRRAFTSGKLSLTDAEAIGLLLDAKSSGQAKLGKRTSRDRLKYELHEISKELVQLLGSMYARIDYPDEELGDFSDDECIEILKSSLTRINKLLDSYKTGKAISVGISTVITGLPNVGKSTLYNMLLGEESAIVTDIPGTTRDILESNVTIGNLMLRIADTAGIRENAVDAVEKIGIERSWQRLSEAKLIIALFDSSSPLSDDNIKLIEKIKEQEVPAIAVLTKSDKAEAVKFISENLQVLSKSFNNIISISYTDRNYATSALSAQLEKIYNSEGLTPGYDAIISSARQHSALVSAKEHILTALEAITSGYPQDVISSDIELALGEIKLLDGRCISEDVVADIFSRFCVGK